MTAQLVRLDDYRPHYASFARCFACWQKWVEVAPVGTKLSECPKCGRMSGVAYLYFDGLFRIWRGMMMLAAIPLAFYMRGR